MRYHRNVISGAIQGKFFSCWTYGPVMMQSLIYRGKCAIYKN